MLEVVDIHKTYEGEPLLNGVSFQVKDRELVCLLGASGSGKSTLLRIIAGTEEAESGQILWNGVAQNSIPTHLRGFGLMFQDYALFPHLTVAQNIAYGLKMKHLPTVEVNQKVQNALRTIRMESLAERPVTELSGGEQQRVALARALAPSPALLMLDEPLGALDHSLRVRLIAELRLILRESGIPAIYVTHDREEAFSLADRLLLLHDGLILQQGTPRELFSRPVNAWAAEFLGLGNLVAVTARAVESNRIQTAVGEFEIDSGQTDVQGSTSFILLRPEDAHISAEPASGPNQIRGLVRDCLFMGENFQLELEVNGLLLQVNSAFPIQPGEWANVSWPSESIQLLPG